METKISKHDFAARVLTASIQELVDIFNLSVGNRGWTSMRAVYDQLLIQEFKRRGIDISAIHKGNTTDFSRKVVYDETQQKLLIAEDK
jgi:DNA phosphorothioation-dependent restriction protein DptG